MQRVPAKHKQLMRLSMVVKVTRTKCNNLRITGMYVCGCMHPRVSTSQQSAVV